MALRYDKHLNEGINMENQCICGQHAVSIDLSEVNDAPGPYAMSFGFDLAPLCTSILEIGLVHPPCIAIDGAGRTEIVTGYRRMLALKQLGWRKVLCEDVSVLLPSPLQRLVFALYDNRASRTFNPVEKAMVLKRLDPFLDRRDLVSRFMPLLGLPSHEGTLLFYLSLAEMKDKYLEALAGGRLSLNAARSFLDLDDDQAECAFQIVSNLMLNVNQQIQFIDIMIDLSSIEGTSFSRILNREPVRTVLESELLNTPQKAKKLLEKLRSLRYPRWQEAEKKFQEKLDRVDLPDGTRIDHPAYFEAPGYRLEVNFRDGENLMRKLQNLSQLSGLKKFRDPLDDDD